MQFALLTDIHGNAQALQAVLQNIAERGIEKIYCTGGPHRYRSSNK